MNITVRTSSKNQSQGESNDNQEEENLDQRCYIFKPGEYGVREEKDDETGEHEDADYKTH